MNERINPYGDGNEPEYIRAEKYRIRGQESRDNLGSLLSRWGVKPGEVKTISRPHRKRFFLAELKDCLKKDISLVDHKRQLQAHGILSVSWGLSSDPALIRCCDNNSYEIYPYNIHLSKDLVTVTNWLPKKLEFEPLMYGVSLKEKKDGGERLNLTKGGYNPLYICAYPSIIPNLSGELDKRIGKDATSLLLVR